MMDKPSLSAEDVQGFAEFLIKNPRNITAFINVVTLFPRGFRQRFEALVVRMSELNK